jgi:hypothetical protein
MPTSSLFDALPPDIALAPIGKYLRWVHTRAHADLDGIPDALAAFYQGAVERWGGRCDTARQRCARLWEPAWGASSAPHPRDAEEADLEAAVMQISRGYAQSMRDYSRLFRTFSHSLALPERGFQRVFRSTPAFAQLAVKPVSQWRSPRILAGVNDAVCFACVVIRVAETITTTAYVTRDSIVIGGYRAIQCAEIRAVFRRVRARRETAIEFFLRDGKSCLVDFAPTDAAEIARAMRICRLDRAEWVQRAPFKEFFRRIGDTAAWVERRTSNFDYLMRLNIVAGRSFRDVAAYPVFPWVIVDFESDNLDLTRDASFRKFDQPVGLGAPSSPAVVARWLGRLGPFAALPASPLEPFRAIERPTAGGNSCLSSSACRSSSSDRDARRTSGCHGGQLTPSNSCICTDEHSNRNSCRCTSTSGSMPCSGSCLLSS